MPGSNEFRFPESGLTDAERRQLAELERGLIADDPELANALIRGAVPDGRPDRTTRALCGALALVVLMFALLVGGPGAAAFSAMAVLGTSLIALKLRAQPAL